jgi:PAS domain S-box-containing protein
MLSVSVVRSGNGEPLYFVSQIEDITTRKVMDEELRKRDEILSMAQRMADLGSWEHDPATGAMRWSDQLYRIAGYEPGEIAPTMENFFGLLHPRDAAAVRRETEECARRGVPFDREFRIVRKDGAERVIHAQSQRYPGGKGGQMGGIAQDITERKELSQSYRKALDNLLAAQEYALLGNWEWDAATGAVRWSEQIYRNLGYEVGEVAPGLETIMDRIHPDDRARFMEGMERSMRGHAPFDEEVRVFRHDTGELRYLSDRGMAMVDERGRVERIVGTSQDVTAIRLHEQALRESEARYRSVVDNVGIGVSLISPKMEILALNKQMRDWFPHVDVGEKPICYRAFNTPPRDTICSYCPTHKTLEDGQTHEAVTETPAGEATLNYRVVSTPIRDDGGNVVAAIEMVEDITVRQRAEEALRRHNKELNRMMEELKKAQALLVRSEKLASIGTLSAGVAHEILNPLNIIAMTTQLMQSAPDLPAGMADRLEEVMTQIRRATKITDNLRMFAHLHKDENKFVNIPEIFDRTATLIEHDLNLDNIFIDKRFDPRAPGVYADEDKIAQVFLNLLTNARDALKGEAGGVIAVSSKAQDGDLVITFSDSGPGVPSHIREKIFDPFFTTKEPGEGTGLGLSIVHSIVETHRGTIRVESEPGGGSTFVITLPVGGRETEGARE